MTTLDYFLIFWLLFVLLWVVDLGWVKVGAGKLYRRLLGQTEYKDMELNHRAVIYMLMSVGLLLLVVVPSVDSENFRMAALRGGAFGFITHALASMSNAEILNKWSDKLILLDLFWNTFLSLFASLAGYLLVTGLQA